MSRTFQKIYDALGEAYKVCVDRDASGVDTQITGNPPFPAVPLATQIVIGYTGNNPTTVTYKNASGTTLATCTIGYTGNNPTSVSWVFV